ncbi:AAA family ATPase [Stenotrophomonas maltophilia]|uniref:AAA family ATPase n=1 Tax=Stenotrophomonas maltophilia TaxID=40324 RepID=UPI002AA27D8D|nr:ATP-binding protein [Stenotrophomonas maltophilia]HEL7759447.1 ATP-binding protein [Stenotrophomonas maltophilia]
MRLLQHSAYRGPRDRLRAALDNHRPGHMVFVIGPSGVGKTTMRRSVMREMFGNPNLWEKGKVPAIETFACLPVGAYFSSRYLARELLQELNAPTLTWALEGGSPRSSPPSDIQAEVRGKDLQLGRYQLRLTEAECWSSVRQSMIARDCKYVAIDQISALLVNHKDKSPADHALHLMALAESAGSMLIMTGIHRAAQLWSIESELRRSVTSIWVPPYSVKRREDRAPFLRLLTSLSERHNFSEQDLLIRMAADLLVATGGVYGEVAQLLSRAADAAKQEGSERILKRHIEASYYSDNDLANLWRDIEEFEDAMEAGSVTARAKQLKSSWASSYGEVCREV